MSMDEITGVQALQRKHPDLPMLPGHDFRREFEFIRHGTFSWFSNLDVATGQIIEPSWGPTRCEDDCLAHLQRLIESSPETKRWHLIMGNLNTHCSESLVRWVAGLEGIGQETLGVKDKRGILRSIKSRTAFLHDPTHRVVFLLHSKACILDESDRNLAKSPGAQAPQTWQFYLCTGYLGYPFH